MPTRLSLVNAYETVELPYGNEKINIRARVELIGSQSADGKKFRELEIKDDELRREQRQMLADLQATLDDVGEAFKTPPKERVLQFRGAMDETMNALDDALALARDTGEFAPLEVILGNGQRELGEFGNELFKTPDEIETQSADAEKKLLELQEKLKVNATAIHANIAKQLALLICWWDVTEGEDEKMYPITAANILSFPEASRIALLTEIKKKLTAR